MRGTVSVNRATEQATATADRSIRTSVAFDVVTGGYTVSSDTGTQTFLPSDIDPAQSSAGAIAYIKRNGSTTDSLTLTRAGTSGRFTYQYVGSGFWQRTTEGPTAIEGSIDGFVYGFPTAAAVLPRTGKASYDIDLLGVISPQTGISGSGSLLVWFDTAAIVISGSLDPTIAGARREAFSGNGLLFSGNSIGGELRLFDFGEFVGRIDGKFFGPQFEEVGLSFALAQADGRKAVGTITGRGGTQTASNASLKQQTVNDFYPGQGGRLGLTMNGASGSNTAPITYTDLSQRIGFFSVSYNAATQAYTVSAGNRSASGETASGTVSESFGLLDTQRAFTITSPTGDSTSRYGNLDYVAAARWAKRTGVGANTEYLIDEMAFGIRTPLAAVPRTGEGGYAIGVFGTAADPDFRNLVLFAGQGTLRANFASGAITLNAGINYREDIFLSGVTAQRASGTLAGTATLASTDNSFTGSITLDGIGNYTGPITGNFFGPAAQEIGGGFSASDGNGRAVGSFVGLKDDGILASGQPLLNVPSPTSFAPFANAKEDGVNRAPTGTAVTYSPDTKSYRVVVPTEFLDLTTPNNFDRDLLTAFGPANVLAGQTDASFTTNQVTANGKQITGRLFNPGPGNPTLALTYTSFIDITTTVLDQQGQPTNERQRLYLPFGVATSQAGQPRTGNATYDGVAFGNGRTATNNNLAVTGTSRLAVDFGSNSFTSTLNLTDTSNGQAFAAFNFQGQVATNGFFGNGNPSPPLGQIGNAGVFQGNFFGPAAEEFGAVFDIIRDDASGRTFITGVTVGKRN